MVDYSEIDSDTEVAGPVCGPDCVVCDIIFGHHRNRKVVIERESIVLILTLKQRGRDSETIVRERPRRRRRPTRRQRRRQTAC